MKIAVITLILAWIMVGCTSGQGQVQIQVDSDSQQIIAKIAGRRAGYELAKEYPDIAVEVHAACQEIIAQNKPDLVGIAVNRLIAVMLAAEIDDPLLAADISDILSMIQIEPGVELTKNQMAVIKAVAKGLVSGIEMAKELVARYSLLVKKNQQPATSNEQPATRSEL